VAALRRAAAAAGVEAHLVGGVLRDRLLGLPSRDFDSVVAGAGGAIAAAVADRLGAHLVRLGGKEFAAYRVVDARGEGWVLDVWDREGAPLAADLARRDFTVNSVALDLGAAPRADDAERLVDPFDGVGDVGRRLLKATTPGSFAGDALRVLRLPRLLVQLPGFTADPASLELARLAAPGLAGVAAERVREELVLLFQREGAPEALALLLALGVYPGLWRGAPGALQPAAAERWAARAVVELERLVPRAAELQALAPGAPPVDLLAARFTATFEHLPDGDLPAAARRARAVEAAERFRDAGYATRHLTARVARLLAAGPPPAGERERRRWLHALGGLWPTALARAGTAADGGGDRVRWRAVAGELAALMERDGGRILDPPRLLGGEEVQRLLGIPAGPEVGRALARLRRAQVDGEVGGREEAEALLRRGG
jgi:tRNA nucleotidyltransferase/poly(A) polymerase